eukprot:m51a1_g6785 hypothetical protein (888) ;mRNA; f:160756-165872
MQRVHKGISTGQYKPKAALMEESKTRFARTPEQKAATAQHKAALEAASMKEALRDAVKETLAGVLQIHKQRVQKKVVVKPIVTNHPGSLIMIDLADFSAIKGLNNGVPFIMLAVDHFSKKLFTFPLRNKEPKLVAKCMEMVLADFQHSPWRGIKHVRSKPYTPQAHGLIERAVRTLRRMLQILFTLSGSKRWLGSVLQKVTSCYNNMPHTANHMIAKTVPSARQQAVEPEEGDQVRVSLNWLDPQVRREGRMRKSSLAQFYDQVGQLAAKRQRVAMESDLLRTVVSRGYSPVIIDEEYRTRGDCEACKRLLGLGELGVDVSGRPGSGMHCNGDVASVRASPDLPDLRSIPVLDEAMVQALITSYNETTTRWASVDLPSYMLEKNSPLFVPIKLITDLLGALPDQRDIAVGTRSSCFRLRSRRDAVLTFLLDRDPEVASLPTLKSLLRFVEDDKVREELGSRFDKLPAVGECTLARGLANHLRPFVFTCGCKDRDTKMWIWDHEGHIWDNTHGSEMIAAHLSVLSAHLYPNAPGSEKLESHSKRTAVTRDIVQFLKDNDKAIAMDCQPGVLPVFGGQLLDLSTMTVRERVPTDLFSMETAVPLPEDEATPRVDDLIKEVLGGSEEVMRAFQRAMGMTLNTKSTVMALVRNALGPLYVEAQKTLFVSFKAKDDGGPNPFLASLRLARMAGFSETDRGQHFSESLLKAVTGGDPIPTRLLYSSDVVKVVPNFVLFYATNYLPKVDSNSAGLFDRVVPWVFPLRFVENPTKPNERKLDPSFRDRVTQDRGYLSEFLMWLVKGEADYRTNGGLRLPQSVLDWTRGPSGSEFTASSAIYEAYRQWGNWVGLKYELDSMAFMQTFATYAEGAGWEKARADHGSVRGYKGIVIKA